MLFTILACVMVFAQLVANVMSSLIPPYAIGIFSVSGGFWTFPIVYVISDLVQEVYGFNASRRISWITGALALATSLVFFVGYKVYPYSTSLVELGSASWVITIAGLLAMQLGNLTNDIIFLKCIKLPRLPRFWTSSLCGEIVDSTVFVFCGLFLVFRLPIHVCLVTIGSQVVFKMLVETCWSPVSLALAPRFCDWAGVKPARERPVEKISIFG